VAPGIRSIATHGHKPGHTVFQVTDGHAGMPVLGDTTNRPGLFARNPGWHAMIDTDPAEASRGALLDRAAAGGVRVTGYHFPFPIAGRIAREGQGCCCCAAEWIDGV
jgi:glyoxylase-like metal-dependent hydrolase (beta-lactamase superfamily II)